MSRRDTPKTGIVTRWQWHEATYAAIRIADCIQQAGGDVSILPTNYVPGVLDTPWQSEIVTGCRLTEWAADCDQVVFTHCPSLVQQKWMRSCKKRAICLPLWHELELQDLTELMQCDLVIATSDAFADWLRQVAIPSLRLSWDAGLPLTAKSSVAGPAIRVLWPLYAEAVNRVTATACEILHRAMRMQPAMTLTILMSAATLSGQARHSLRKFQRDYGAARLQLVASTTLLSRQLAYMQHDLTFWPTIAESLGLVGLTSVALGTPVVTYGVPPITELLPQSSAWHVPVKLQYSSVRAPYAVHGERAMDTLMQSLAAEPEQIWEKQRSVLHGLSERRTTFDEVLGRALLLR